MKSPLLDGSPPLQLQNVLNLSRPSFKLKSDIEVIYFNIKRPHIDNSVVNKIEGSLSWGTMVSSNQNNSTKEKNSDTFFFCFR